MFLLIASPLSADTQKLMVLVFESAHPDSAIENLLYLSIGVELSNLGYSSILKESGTQKSSYQLIVGYGFLDNELDVTLTLTQDNASSKRPSEVHFILPLDTTFEQILAEKVQDIVSLGELDAAADKENVPEIGGLFQAELITRKSLLRTEKTVRLECLLGSGIVPVLGDFSAYAPMGVYSVFQAGVLFLKPGWSLAAGGRFSFTPVLLTEGVEGGPVVFTTLGANVQLGLGAAQRFKLSGAVSGGAAITSVGETGDTVSKTVPYVDAGILAAFPLGRNWFLGGDVRFLAVFDPEIPIYGITAALIAIMEY